MFKPIQSTLKIIPNVELDESAQADLYEKDADIQILLNNSINASGAILENKNHI
jgi:hypothetical protein